MKTKLYSPLHYDIDAFGKLFPSPLLVHLPHLRFFVQRVSFSSIFVSIVRLMKQRSVWAFVSPLRTLVGYALVDLERSITLLVVIGPGFGEHWNSMIKRTKNFLCVQVTYISSASERFCSRSRSLLVRSRPFKPFWTVLYKQYRPQQTEIKVLINNEQVKTHF